MVENIDKYMVRGGKILMHFWTNNKNLGFLLTLKNKLIWMKNGITCYLFKIMRDQGNYYIYLGIKSWCSQNLRKKK